MPADSLNKIIEKIDMFNIKYIISIDNDWLPRVATINIEEDLRSFLSLKSIIISDNENREIGNNAISTIKELLETDNNELEYLKTKVKRELDRKGKIDETLIPLIWMFKAIKKQRPDVKIVKKSRPNIRFASYKQNCLFILDRNMGGINSDIIIESILKINENRKDRNDLILIYTNQDMNDFKDHNSKLLYLQTKTVDENKKFLLIYNMWAIRKNSDRITISNQINETLLQSMYGNSLYGVINNRKENEKRAYQELIKIDSKELSNSMQDSFIEGDNIVDSIDRIYDSLKSKFEIENSSANHLQHIERLIGYERESVNLIFQNLQNSNDSHKQANPNVYETFRDERLKSKLKACLNGSSSYHSIIDYGVNKSFTDISTGDIFMFKHTKNSGWKYSILISQSCDCVIRILNNNNINNIDRVCKEMSLLIFDPTEITTNISDSKLKTIKYNISSKIWPVKYGDKVYIFKPTEKIVNISDYILDLCSLNDNGEANLNFDLDISQKFKPFHSHKYFSKFKEKKFGNEFKNVGNSILKSYESVFKNLFMQAKEESACTADCINSESIKDPFNKLRNEIFEQTITLKYNILFENNQFHIKRIGRLEPKRTLLIIQDMVNKLSKVGTDPIVSLNNI